MCIVCFVVCVCFIDCYGILFVCFVREGNSFFEFGLILYVYMCYYVDLYYDLFVLFVYLYCNDGGFFCCL